MYGIALVLAAVVLTGLVALAVRRRTSRTEALVSRVEPLPAGVKHLASTVSDLSDLELHLPAVHRALAPRRRLGTLLQQPR